LLPACLWPLGTLVSEPLKGANPAEGGSLAAGFAASAHFGFGGSSSGPQSAVFPPACAMLPGSCLSAVAHPWSDSRCGGLARPPDPVRKPPAGAPRGRSCPYSPPAGPGCGPCAADRTRLPGPGPLGRQRPEVIRPSYRAAADRTGCTLPIAAGAYCPQVAQPCQVFQHHLQQRLGDGQALGQVPVTVDATFSHESQELV